MREGSKIIEKKRYVKKNIKNMMKKFIIKVKEIKRKWSIKNEKIGYGRMRCIYGRLLKKEEEEKSKRKKKN